MMISATAMRVHAISHLHPGIAGFTDERQSRVARNNWTGGARDSNPFRPNLAIWRGEPFRVSFRPPEAPVRRNFARL